MVLHPDAKAFVTRILADPSDAVIRTVFADWLHEQGGNGNENWARYIRLRTEAGFLHGIDRDLMREDAANVAPLVKARLTVPAARLAPFFVELIDLLPPDRFTVTLGGGFQGPVPHVRAVGEEASRALRALVIGERDNLFAVATDRPDPQVAVELGHLLQGGIVQFPTPTADLDAALARHFPPPKTPSEEAEPEADDRDPLETLTAREACYKLIEEARGEHAAGMEVVALPSGYEVRFLIDGRPLRRHTVSAGRGGELVERFLVLGRRSDSGVSTRPRNTSFGDGVQVVFDGR